MPKNDQAPGVPPGSEVVSIATPFGGWVSSLSGTVSGGAHYGASVEGIEPTLTKPNTAQYAESTAISLFRAERLGHIAPGPVFTKLTDTSSYINQLPLNGFVASTGEGWVVLENGRLVRILNNIGGTASKFDPDLTQNAGAPPGTNHSAHSIQSTVNGDVLIMKDLAAPQVEWVLWSWEDDTDAEISIIKSAGTNENDAWYSILNNANSPKPLTKGVPHKMCQGPDGNVYVTNGSYVEQIVVNGALGSAVKGLELPLGTDWTASSISAYKNYVAVIAYKSVSYTTGVSRGECRLFLWNGISSTVNGVTSVAAQYEFDLPDNYANGIFFDGTTLFAFTNGRNNSSKIWEFTGKAFRKLFETSLLSTSATPNQGSVEIFQDSLMIGATKPSENAHLFRYYNGGFHDEAIITDGTNPATSVGMIKNLFTNYIFAGVKYGSTYAIYYQNNTSYQLNAAFRTILFTEGILGRRLYPLGFKGTVNRFMLYLSQWGTGASIYLSLFKDYVTANPGNAGDLLNVLIDTNTAVTNGDQSGTNHFGGTGYRHYAYPVGTTEIDISDLAIPDISSFYMIITFTHTSISNTAAILRRGVVFWAPSQ